MASMMDEGPKEDVLFMELPAPPGWNKKFLTKLDGMSKKNEVIFIAPTGEEIHSRRQLDEYLKSHPANPPSSEFDWGTGETPRRSARISEKAKAAPSPQTQRRPKKRTRTRSLLKTDAKDAADVVPDSFDKAGVHKLAVKDGTDVETGPFPASAARVPEEGWRIEDATKENQYLEGTKEEEKLKLQDDAR